MGNQKSAPTVLKKALESLKDDVRNGDAFKLVYITNISNPLSSTTPSAFSFGATYDFPILTDDDQKTIKDKTCADFPTDKFQLQIINFFGEGDNKFQKIKEKIEEFLRVAINDISYSKPLLNNWFELFMVNAADKPDKEKKVDLTKRQIIFPVIAVVIDPPISDAEFSEVSDYENYAEITQEFRKIIYESTCDYEFIAQVLGDYLDKRKTISDKTKFKYAFTKDEWQNYEKEFACIPNAEKRQALIKILLLTIITRNSIINQIKGAANL